MNVLVLGGAGGIGSAVCAEAAAAGHRPIVVDRVPVERDWIEADLRDDERVGSIVGEMVERFGGTAALVNCAGTYAARTLDDFSWAEFDESFIVNARAPLQIMLDWATTRQHGVLVTVSSVAARSGSRDVGYTVSKAAIEAATRSLALSLVPRGFRVFTIAPHVVDTPMARAVPAARRQGNLSRSLIPEPCPPEEIAALVMLMLNGRVDHLVGSSINLSAGAAWT